MVRGAVTRSRVLGVSCLDRTMIVRVVIRAVRQFLVVPAWRFGRLLSRRMPGAGNSADLARFQAAGMLCELCPRGPDLRSDWWLCG